MKSHFIHFHTFSLSSTCFFARQSNNEANRSASDDDDVNKNISSARVNVLEPITIYLQSELRLKVAFSSPGLHLSEKLLTRHEPLDIVSSKAPPPPKVSNRRMKMNCFEVPARLVLYFLSWSGFLVSFMMRNDINFALVVMVKTRNETTATLNGNSTLNGTGPSPNYVNFTTFRKL